MLDITFLLVIGGVFAATVGMTLFLTQPSETVAMRLTRNAPPTRAGSPGVSFRTRGFRQRLVAPLARRILAIAAATAPQRVRRQAEMELTMAGSTVSPTVFLGIRGLLMFGFPLLGALYVLTAPAPSNTHWLVFLLSVMWGRRIPSMWLKRRMRNRQRLIDRRLPYALDLMVACLEGGLSLDAAFAKVAEQSDGPLAFEVRRTLQEMALGRPPADAVRDLGIRTGAPDLKRFTENLIQAERMGISLAESLRELARDSRVRRRQAAEEMGRKAPIKMVPVLIFCVLPALAIVIMTPAVVLLMRVFAETAPT